jgi:hypothetical protein
MMKVAIETIFRIAPKSVINALIAFCYRNSDRIASINATLIASACIRTDLQLDGVGLLEQYLLQSSNDDSASNDADDDENQPKRARLEMIHTNGYYNQPTFIQLAR